MLTQLIHELMGAKRRGVESSAASLMASGSANSEAPTEKKLWDVKLVGFDVKAKIKVIKEVRSITGLGLKEAKDLVEAAPRIVKKDLKPENAEEMKALLEAVGADIELV